MSQDINPAEFFKLFSQDTKEGLKNIFQYFKSNPDAIDLVLTAIDGNVSDAANEMTEYEQAILALFLGHIKNDVESVAFMRASMKLMKGIF